MAGAGATTAVAVAALVSSHTFMDVEGGDGDNDHAGMERRRRRGMRTPPPPRSMLYGGVIIGSGFLDIGEATGDGRPCSEERGGGAGRSPPPLPFRPPDSAFVLPVDCVTTEPG